MTISQEKVKPYLIPFTLSAMRNFLTCKKTFAYQVILVIIKTNNMVPVCNHIHKGTSKGFCLFVC